MLVLNTSMVAAVWLGANRINSGEMQIGALVAFLTYLVQILMSVMMATFVVMGCTMLVAAPLTMVGGVFMALREDVSLSAMLLVSVPALVIAVGLVVVRMVPQFREMQTRIDSVNRILREQIIGIRVVRAFVREPDEVERFGLSLIHI